MSRLLSILYIFLLLLLVGIISVSCSYKKSTPKLQHKIECLTKNFNGKVSVYVENLKTGEIVAINENELFPSASLIKIAIMLTIFDKIVQEDLKYNQELIYDDSLLYPGHDVLGSFKNFEKITLNKLLNLMIAHSDNTASLWLQQIAGTGTEINKWLQKNKFKYTRVNSRTKGRKKNWEDFGWGQTSSKEMTLLLKGIRKNAFFSRSTSEEMYRLLTNSYWNNEALSQIPPYIQVASKQGAVSKSRSEVALVNAPSGDYVFCIITKNQKDTRWNYDNEGYELIRKISNTLWNYFEPDYNWTPSYNLKTWQK